MTEKHYIIKDFEDPDTTEDNVVEYRITLQDASQTERFELFFESLADDMGAELHPIED